MNKGSKNIKDTKLKCSTCKEYKDKSEYYKTDKLSRGYDYRCKSCCGKRSSEWHYKNRDKQLFNFKKRKDSLSLEERATAALNHKVWYRNTIEQRLLYRAKERSKKLKLYCDLTIEDIVLPKTCPLLEIPFVMGNKYDKWLSYSLDRIDNSKGYVKGNIQIITYLANTMKSKATKEQLIAFAKNILKLLEDKEE